MQQPANRVIGGSRDMHPLVGHSISGRRRQRPRAERGYRSVRAQGEADLAQRSVAASDRDDAGGAAHDERVAHLAHARGHGDGDAGCRRAGVVAGQQADADTTSVAHRGIDPAGLQERVLAELPAGIDSAHIEVDVATARIAPQNPMTEHGFVHIYDPLRDSVQQARIAELVARLPQYNQVVRVFSDDASSLDAVRDAAERALSP